MHFVPHYRSERHWVKHDYSDIVMNLTDPSCGHTLPLYVLVNFLTDDMNNHNYSFLFRIKHK